MKNTLSAIGLVEPERPPITYRERAPLVLPPAKGAPALPAPQANARETDPQWPKDPESVKRKRDAAEAAKPIVRGYGGRMNDNNATLSVEELRRGRKANAGVPTEPEYKPGDGVREATWLNPLKLFEGRKDDAAPSDEEPSRDLLTDPPTGYRKPPGGRLAKTKGEPIKSANPDREEADPMAYMRAQRGR